MDLDEEEYKATRKLNGLDTDIQVGEYVRTNNGKIYKITNYDKEQNKYHSVKDMVWNIIFPKDIVKHSPNIIDLIEVGDYVNGQKVERINDYGDFKRADFNLDYDDCDAVYNEDIKSIVTHEQFNSVLYKVKE